VTPAKSSARSDHALKRCLETRERLHEIQPQLLANLGFYYAGVNYRGVDGYGRAFSRQVNSAKAAEDVLAAIKFLIGKIHCDTNRIFLTSQSNGSAVLCKFLERFPTVARAAVLQGPSVLPSLDTPQVPGFPRLFVTLGANDPYYRRACRLQAWSEAHHAPIEFQYVRNYTHFTEGAIEARVAQEKAIAEFLLRNL
jgi:predicted esterase